MNLMRSLGASADSQSASSRMSVDLSAPKDIATKKNVAKDQTTQAADESQEPQMFDQVLSNTAAGQKPESKTPAAKSKAVSADAKETSKPDKTATPDIALLMSLLNVLPQNDPAPATAGQPPAATAQDDVLATTAISANPARTPATATEPIAAPVTDTPDSSGPIVLAAALTTVAKDVPSMIEGRVPDKADLFASVLANIESPAPTPAPMLAVPTQQAPTMTAVALALPVTAPGVLDEMPITNGEWPAALGHRLLWAVGEGMQKVEISVNPKDMGPINVHIRIENDKTDIRFTAMHAMTRDVIESSLPRLRDMFSQQGLNLSQAQVFSQTSQDTRGRQPDTNPANPNAVAVDTADVPEPEQARVVHWRRGLVDDYA